MKYLLLITLMVSTMLATASPNYTVGFPRENCVEVLGDSVKRVNLISYTYGYLDAFNKLLYTVDPTSPPIKANDTLIKVIINLCAENREYSVREGIESSVFGIFRLLKERK